jgi:hypothetical protein
MIAPDFAPFTGTSLAITKEGAVADQIQIGSPQGGGNGSGLERAPFSWPVLELDATFPESLRPHVSAIEVDFPSSHAMGIARSLCRDVDRIAGKIVSFSDLEAFEGDLLIHWRSADRSITLICPAGADRQAKLYREELRDGRFFRSDIKPEPRASDIALAIKWVWNQA